jgi:hypothetical protein
MLVKRQFHKAMDANKRHVLLFDHLVGKGKQFSLAVLTLVDCIRCRLGGRHRVGWPREFRTVRRAIRRTCLISCLSAGEGMQGSEFGFGSPGPTRLRPQMPKSPLSVRSVVAIDCALARSSALFFGGEDDPHLLQGDSGRGASVAGFKHGNIDRGTSTTISPRSAFDAHSALCAPLVFVAHSWHCSSASRWRARRCAAQHCGPDRNGASIAKFRTRRPAHICETARYREVSRRSLPVFSDDECRWREAVRSPANFYSRAAARRAAV